MRIFTDLKTLPDDARGAVVALGNFDGVHLGHAAIIRQAAAQAQRLQRRLAVCSFEPHPRSVFFPNDPPFRLTPARVKAERLAALGVDFLYQIPFTDDFRQMVAEDFIQKILVENLHAAHVVAGFDFTFGFQRNGNMALLADRLDALNIGLTEIPPQRDGGNALWSSTRVRDHLLAGEVEAANAILGDAWQIVGCVQKGDQRGRLLGFPTANLALQDFLRPRFGVYAIMAQTEDGLWHKGVANLGRRPTVNGGLERLEAHLFDYTSDLYGQNLRVAFYHFIRVEQHFADLDALQQQIAKDAMLAKKALVTIG